MKVNNSIKEEDILASLKTDYDLSNKTLYKLCEENFTHDKADKILAKTIIIGRTYAVALDRGKDKGKTKSEIKKEKLINDDFYQKVVVPIFNKAELDERLLSIKGINDIEDDIPKILETHLYLMKKLKTINQEDKRSFSSKYLHFHLPNLFFIYDSRAINSINKIIITEKNEYNVSGKKTDLKYSIFFHKLLFLRKQIKEQFSIDLTPRQVDNYLLKFANEQLRKKNRRMLS